jgi:Leucine-rich repeat (LRR) protein
LTSLGPAFFADLEQLEVLNLAGNEIASIEQDTFSKLTKLKALRLDQNQVCLYTL